jgi:DNA invertase Pin-like site-specific DNA recombinase
VLVALLRDIAVGETLHVVRFYRLARSMGYLFAVIEQLEASGATSHNRARNMPTVVRTAKWR